MVARERSFTKAAAQLGVSSSALSHRMRTLEERLGIRLFNRTTRNVSLTEAGERMVAAIGPRFDEIAAEVKAIRSLRDSPSGLIRLTCTDFVANTVLRPKLAKFLQQYSDIKIEIVIDYGLTNIVEQRFDAGIRRGESVSRGMIATRIGPNSRFCVVGSPDYFAKRPIPETPRDLTMHQCINLRLSTHGGLYAWEFEKDGQKLNARVEGPLTFNSIGPIYDAALDGIGLASVPEEMARNDIDQGRLIEVLVDWCPMFDGYHLFYPSRRQSSPAFSALVSVLRYQA